MSLPVKSRVDARLVPDATSSARGCNDRKRDVTTGLSLPPTLTSKSSELRSATGEPSLPTTVTSSRIRSTPLLKVGPCMTGVSVGGGAGGCASAIAGSASSVAASKGNRRKVVVINISVDSPGDG